MLIVVNTCFAENIPGDHSYYWQILNRLVPAFPQQQFLFLSYQPIDKKLGDFSNAKTLQLPGRRFTNPVLQRRIGQFKLNRLVKKQEPAIIINCQGCSSFNMDIPQILLLAELPFDMDGLKNNIAASARRSWKKNLAINLERSVAVLTAASYLKNQLNKKFASAPKKIMVTGIGPELPATVLSWEEKEKIKTRFSDGKEYFLCTNPYHSNDHIITLLKAFSRFKKRQHSNMQLLLPAFFGEKNRDWQKKLETYKFRADVHLTPSLAANEMAELVAAAYGVIDLVASGNSAVSILQSFECQTPLIISAAGSAAEWTDAGATLTANAADADAISAQMMLLYKDEYLRKRLIEAGNKQLGIHNWDNAAKKVQDCLEAVISNC